jgi:hypothetical protein
MCGGRVKDSHNYQVDQIVIETIQCNAPNEPKGHSFSLRNPCIACKIVTGFGAQATCLRRIAARRLGSDQRNVLKRLWFRSKVAAVSYLKQPFRVCFRH